MHAPTYAQALDDLFARGAELLTQPGTPRRKFELDHMRILSQALGAPHQKFPSLLIAGTNGKGSTAATLAAIFAAAGYRTGLYTSPHLVRVNERIQISTPASPQLQPISDEDFARLYFHVDNTARQLVLDQKLPHAPSFFEIITALAFCYFVENSPDIVILEVGLGGRLDATNIVNPLLSILTDISLDHTEWLGSTIAEITREKTGILRPNGLLVTLPQHPDANQVIGERAAELNVTGISATDFIPQRSRSFESESRAAANTINAAHFRNQYPLDIPSANSNAPATTIQVDSPLAGAHQQRNIALAVAAATALTRIANYKLTPQQIEQGICQTNWPARQEFIPPSTPNQAPVLLDVAHNPAGAWTLRSALSALPETPRTLIFGCLADKPIEEMMQILFPLFDPIHPDIDNPESTHQRILLTPADSQRAASLESLTAAAEKLGYKTEAILSPTEALTQAQSITPANGLIVVTGSLYLVGKLRAQLLNL
jgi:dihydrofolate synthase/folylpolyglutamate synthase